MAGSVNYSLLDADSDRENRFLIKIFCWPEKCCCGHWNINWSRKKTLDEEIKSS